MTLKFLIFGKTGWIGGLLGDLLQSMGHEFVFAESRLEDRRCLIAEIQKVKDVKECCEWFICHCTTRFLCIPMSSNRSNLATF